MEQKLNAALPMDVTESGIETLVRLKQFSKAELPMVVTELGIEIFRKLKQ